MARTCGALNILTLTCASRRNGVHFFDISTSKSAPKLVCFVHLASKCASRHNGVQLYISHLTTWLRTRRFSEPTFQPSGATNHWKNAVFLDFPTFSGTWIFFLRRLSLFDLLSSSLLFSSLTLPISAFSSVHVVGSLTSKLPQLQLQLQLPLPLLYTTLQYSTLHYTTLR